MCIGALFLSGADLSLAEKIFLKFRIVGEHLLGIMTKFSRDLVTDLSDLFDGGVIFYYLHIHLQAVPRE